MADNQVDLKLNLDFKGVDDALYQMIGQFNGTDKEFQKIATNIQKNAKNLEAAIKLFGPASQQAGTATKQLEKDFQSLVANGIDPASEGFKKMKASMPTSTGLDSTAGSLRKNNQQWSSLALIVQDLPFGFRGIQNNLPALFGSMATGTGAAYFGFSALVAAITAFDMGIFGATKKTVDFRKALKETNDEIRTTLNYTNSEISNLEGLIDVLSDVNTSESIRKKALSELKEAITQVDESEGKKIKTDGDAIGITYKYIEALRQRQMQEVLGKRIAEIELAQIEKRNTLTIETNKANRGFHPIDMFMGNSELQNLQTEIIANETLLRQLEELRKGNTKALLLNPFSKYNAKGQTTKEGEAQAKKDLERNQKFNEQVIQDLIDSKKLEVKLFEDDAFKKYAVSVELADLERQLGIEKIKNSENNERQKAILIEGLNREYANKILLIDQSMQEQLLVQDDRARKEKKRRDENDLREAKVISDRELQNSLDSLKIQSDVAMKIANLSGNANAADRIKILEQYKAGLYDLASVGGYTAEQFDKIDDAIKRVDAAIAGSKDKVKDFSISWQDTSNTINGILTNLVRDSITKFAENIGKALAGEGTNPFQGFGEMIADAAIGIGKALIAYGVAISAFALAISNPLAAIAAGAALVIAGSFLKSKISQKNNNNTPTAFANGGIISGPTLGLMGEYPGASSNPEVVAPLDKLKSLIGNSGGGTLEAKISGNDLLILMNKTNRNNQSTF
jgi:hypothetical protein